MNKKIIKIFLVVIWMIVIFLLSNQTATDSGNLSKSVVDKTIISTYKVINPEATEKDITNVRNNVVLPVRKITHFMMYLVLGILIISLLKEYKITNKNIIALSIIICLLYAISDEIHQLYVPGRSGEIRDVMIDTLGSVVGITSYYLLILKKKIKK